jgi:glycosyltransferase involved in cell wall biosynthesis
MIKCLVDDGDRDGLPNVLIEAQSLPASYQMRLRYRNFIEDGLNGHLVTPDNPLLLADKIIDLIQNPAKRLQMGESGRKIVGSRFSHVSGIGALVKNFDAALARETIKIAPKPQKQSFGADGGRFLCTNEAANLA